MTKKTLTKKTACKAPAKKEPFVTKTDLPKAGGEEAKVAIREAAEEYSAKISAEALAIAKHERPVKQAKSKSSSSKFFSFFFIVSDP